MVIQPRQMSKMALSRHLLTQLVCPVSKLGLHLLKDDQLVYLNAEINAGNIRNMAGEKITEPFKQALITENQTMIYPLIEDVPLLVESKGIDTSQMQQWNLHRKR